VAEREAIQHQNAMIEENAYALSTASVYYDHMTGQKKVHIPGLVAVPEHIFTCTWSFWSREHAVMFKLARGGEL
jgi:hypothetical protein